MILSCFGIVESPDRFNRSTTVVTELRMIAYPTYLELMLEVTKNLIELLGLQLLRKAKTKLKEWATEKGIINA